MSNIRITSQSHPRQLAWARRARWERRAHTRLLRGEKDRCSRGPHKPLLQSTVGRGGRADTSRRPGTARPNTQASTRSRAAHCTLHAPCKAASTLPGRTARPQRNRGPQSRFRRCTCHPPHNGRGLRTLASRNAGTAAPQRLALSTRGGCAWLPLGEACHVSKGPFRTAGV